MNKKLRRKLQKILRIIFFMLLLFLSAVITLILAIVFWGDNTNNSDINNPANNKVRITEEEKFKIKADIEEQFLKKWKSAYESRNIKDIVFLHYFYEKKDYETLEDKLNSEIGGTGSLIELTLSNVQIMVETSKTYVEVEFTLEVRENDVKRSGKVFLGLQYQQGWKILQEDIPSGLLVFSSLSEPIALNTVHPTSCPDNQEPFESKIPVDNNKHNFSVKDRDVREILSAMSLEEKVGQMFMIGFEGQSASSVSNRIQEIKPGGIIIFYRNFSSVIQMKSLTENLQDYVTNTKIKLLIATDQEGGQIVNIVDGTYFPSNLSIGDMGDEKYAGEVGIKLANTLKSSGLNMNLAPVLDLYNSSSVVGARSFGTSRDLVASMGLNMTGELIKKGIIPTIKHFPGHGATSIDSHKSLPLVSKSKEDLKKSDLYPFQYVINNTGNQYIVVMVGHIEYKELDYGDKKPLPAGLSKKIVTDLLRKEMGFYGVVMTDDMEMGAITDYYGVGEATVEAVKAGVDLILVCHTSGSQFDAYDSLLEAVKNNKISEQRIDEAVARILLLKKGYGLLNI